MGEAKKGGNKGKIGALILSFGVSIGLLAFLLNDLNWAEFTKELKNSNPWCLALFLLLFYLCFWARAIRWGHLLPTGPKYSTKRLFDATMIGFFANMVLPLRAGEFIRPWALSRWQKVSGLTAFASIVVERVFDVLALMVILGFCINAVELSDDLDLLVKGAQGLMLVAGVIVCVMIVSYARPQLILGLLQKLLSLTIESKLPELSQKILTFAQEFIDGFRSISSAKELVSVVFWSFALWILMSLYYQVGVWAFGDYPTLWVGFTISAFIALAVALPSAPGFVGPFQLGCVLALSGVFAYPREKALAYSVIVHVFQIIPIILHGLYILNREGMGLADLRKGQEEEQELVA